MVRARVGRGGVGGVGVGRDGVGRDWGGLGWVRGLACAGVAIYTPFLHMLVCVLEVSALH